MNSAQRSTGDLKLIGQWGYGVCNAVHLVGNTAYAGNGRYLQAIDLSKPDTFIVRWEHLLLSYIVDIAREDSLLYVLYANRVMILNIADSSMISIVHEFSISGLSVPKQILVENQILYILTISSIVAIDVTNPLFPVDRDGISADEHVQEISIHRGYLYISYGHYGGTTDIINATDPGNLEYVGDLARFFLSIPDVGFLDNLLFLPYGEFVGDSLYVMGLMAYDISSPLSPTLRGVDTLLYGRRSSFDDIMPMGISVKDSIAYILTVDSGLYSVNIADPDEIHILGKIHRPETQPRVVTRKLSIDNINRGAVPVEYGFWYIDTLNSGGSEISFYRTGGAAVRSSIIDSFLILSEYGIGFSIIDVSDLSHPVKLGHLDLPRRFPANTVIEPTQLTTNERYCFLGMNYGVEIADIGDRANPLWVGYIPYDNDNDVGVKGMFTVDSQYAYVMEFDSTFTVYDLSLLPSIVKTGVLNLMHYYTRFGHMTIRNGFVYFGDLSSDSTVIVDVRDENQPREVNILPISSNDIAVRDTTLLCATFSGILVLSISRPDSPQVLYQIDIGATYYLSLGGTFLYATTYDSIATIDLTVLDSPKVLGKAAPPLWGYYSLDAWDRYIIFSYGVNGFGVYLNDYVTHVSDGHPIPSATFTLFHNYPNPFNASTIIRYELDQPGFVRLTINNILGQRITTLIDQNQSTGQYSITYNGANLTSGVYTYVLECEGERKIGKMIVTR
ncbi:MAG TPA: T9SS type A sorting domain-containing protein [Bacteroidota bacterium]|nr:T9SS type A sorting domain-containing protein [Bacteroidota bacterium]